MLVLKCRSLLVESAAENVSRRVPFGDKSALPLGVKTKGGKPMKVYLLLVVESDEEV